MSVETDGLLVTRSAKRAAGYLARWAALALLVAVANPSSARASPDAPGSKVKHYTVRAEVVEMPDRPGGSVTLRHEAVDDFTDETGVVVGMNSMIMPFPVGREASLKGIMVGDKIEAAFVIDWEQGFMELERITKLPRETVLRYRKARLAGNAATRSDVAEHQEKKP